MSLQDRSPDQKMAAKLLDENILEHASPETAPVLPSLHEAPHTSHHSPDVLAMSATPYGIDVVGLTKLNIDKDNEALAQIGGVEGLINLLHSSHSTGIDPSPGEWSPESRQLWFGKNKVPAPPGKTFLGLMLANLKDPIIILLIFAATISTGLGAGIPEQRAKGEWIEGAAIWVAVLLVTGVGAANDYQKEQQFRKLNEQRETIDVKVLRAGKQELVVNNDVVVGDLLLLDAGDKIVADCILVENTQQLVLDEASLTGESDPVKKNVEDPWIRSGTQVSEGSGKALVIAVGPNSDYCKTMMLINEAGDENTPLQDKLEVVAGLIGKVGFAVAVAVFIALMIMWCVKNNGFPVSKINDNGPIQFFLYAITIIVVAVPEGLPLAVTISLAYSMKKMLQDQNFVRHLSACETMGGATAICSDKTGTLTENRMSVEQGWFAGVHHRTTPGLKDVPSQVAANLQVNIAMNSKAFLIDATTPGGRVGYVGSSTECALLMMLRSWGIEYNDVRKERERDMVKLFGFTSARKMSSVLLKEGSKYRLYNKGAAEWVLRKCTSLVDAQGQVVAMTPEKSEEISKIIMSMAQRGLRCICLTYADYEVEDASRPDDFFEDPTNMDCNLTALAIVGIKDPVRKEVPHAVATCQNAGITVRMVTGDNIHTAKHIARECGILYEDDHIAMEGPDFRAMHETRLADLQELVPKLRVLARSSPEDKLTLVKLLKGRGEVVAVTGDGTNDAPALKESDVGLAMGIAGTEVAKEAADIIILDDNFTSIVKSVLWGRSVFNNIRKFLQFQLTVNCSALLIVFIGAVAGMMEPLTVLQLLWVNLIMDTMGALALATEPPSPSLLDQAPYDRETPLINRKMWKHIIIQGVFQVFIMLMCLYVVPKFISYYSIITEDEFYRNSCGLIADHMNIPLGTGNYNNGSFPDGRWFCQVMNYCGFPLNQKLANTPACPLSELFRNQGEVNVPADQTQALCVNVTSTGCEVSNRFSDARDYMDKAFRDEVEEDWKRPLSLLFNFFIMMQIFNEICCRRINDEYDFFSGLLTSPIFMAVIAITVGLQAIIINFLGLFFKVIPLDWHEWLVSFAVGFLTCIVSWIIRFVSRNCGWNGDVLMLRRGLRRNASGRTTSGRTASGRAFSGRTADGRAISGRTTSGRAFSGRTTSGKATVFPDAGLKRDSNPSWLPLNNAPPSAEVRTGSGRVGSGKPGKASTDAGSGRFAGETSNTGGRVNHGRTDSGRTGSGRTLSNKVTPF